VLSNGLECGVELVLSRHFRGRWPKALPGEPWMKRFLDLSLRMVSSAWPASLYINIYLYVYMCIHKYWGGPVHIHAQSLKAAEWLDAE
jgi:hypothetical protein|tara:strand:- start:223 stop:486 length:264 start_codon:yes stop_codon:yes gene_type:complete